MNRAYPAIALALALGLTAPAAGQGQAGFPPIPGPFMPAPGAPGMGPVPFGAPGYAAAPVRPMFQPPANAMRLPYWMQQAPGGQPVAVPEGMGGATGESVATGFGQATASGALPTYPAQPAAPGYGAAAPAPPGMAPPQGWVFGAPPGWNNAPYVPQPGWGGGWGGVQPGGPGRN
ncbi:hypothetical protein [Sinisalibacter aestuarii]|uniref:Translation initiation factor IF-2 n=1 Tax=Sinisalibacter aestuarii TaxID=2949426 RepID=A0ABQ5LR56_9RHOB|nr:hypothetical protein [Sinisalibacter aestuarii]GKY87494.1 hypothetical protein STA1M1_13630 [Sinisalibacter aestuarii]